jgi:hypothetical protein
MPLRELEASRVRFGYRRLIVMLRRLAGQSQAGPTQLYTEDGLMVRIKLRRKVARARAGPSISCNAFHQNCRWILSPHGRLMGAGFAC